MTGGETETQRWLLNPHFVPPSPRVLESSLSPAFAAMPWVPLGLCPFSYSWEHHSGFAHLISLCQSELMLPNEISESV